VVVVIVFSCPLPRQQKAKAIPPRSHERVSVASSPHANRARFSSANNQAPDVPEITSRDQVEAAAALRIVLRWGETEYGRGVGPDRLDCDCEIRGFGGEIDRR